MTCFRGCFGSSKDQKRIKQRRKVIPRDQKPKIQNLVKDDLSLEQSIKEQPVNPVQESREKTEVLPLSLKRRKKVTFDTNVTTYEHIQVYDSTESLLEKNEKGETFPNNSKDDALVSKIPNYRYGNCLESEDEVEDLDDEDYYDSYEDPDDFDEEEDDDDRDDDEEEEEEKTLRTNRSTRDENGYVLSVLNPVENLMQWKALKLKGTKLKPLNFKGQKENSLESKNHNQEAVIDTSLSNWLISSENYTKNNKAS